jgi:hypothetical protein
MTYEVMTVKRLSTGYVRVSSGEAWAQLPASVYDQLSPGEYIPDEYVFEPSWGWLMKPVTEEAQP